MEKRPVKSVIERAVLPAALAGLGPAARDFQAAAHIRELSLRRRRRAASWCSPRRRGEGGGAGRMTVRLRAAGGGGLPRAGAAGARRRHRARRRDDGGHGGAAAAGDGGARGQDRRACSPGSTWRAKRSGSATPASRSAGVRCDGDRVRAGRRRGRVPRPARRACSPPSGPRSTSCSGCPAPPRWRASSWTRRPAASSCSTRARPRRCCGRSRNTPCAPAARPITACGSTTAS